MGTVEYSLEKEIWPVFEKGPMPFFAATDLDFQEQS